MGETVLKKHTSYQVVTARDGEEAVAKAVVERSDLILMHVVMPKMDGFTACREIRKKDGLQGVPIVMVNSRGEPGNVQMCSLADRASVSLTPGKRCSILRTDKELHEEYESHVA